MKERFIDRLKRMTDTELLAVQKRTLDTMKEAKGSGSCALQAAIYFDLQFIIAEMEQRKQPTL